MVGMGSRPFLWSFRLNVPGSRNNLDRSVVLSPPHALAMPAKMFWIFSALALSRETCRRWSR
jgi:hypothetical protein